MKEPAVQYTILGVLLAWALIAQLTFSALGVYAQLTSTRFSRLPFELQDYTATIRYVPPPYSASGLKAGDEVDALDGKPVEGAIQFDSYRFKLRPGDKLVIKVHRNENGQLKVIDIPVVMQKDWRNIGWLFTIGVSVLLPVFCLLIGFYIVFARPRDPLAWITMAMLASFGQLAGSRISWAVPSPWRELTMVYHPILSNTWPLWMLLFALYFPKPFPLISRQRWIAFVLAIPPVLFASVDLYGNFREGSDIHGLHALADFEVRSATPSTVLNILYVCGFFALLWWKRTQLSANDDRRRLRLMIAGSAFRSRRSYLLCWAS